MTRRRRNNRLEDIASHAGVGIATVDRVLNERGGVGQKNSNKGSRERKDAWCKTDLTIRKASPPCG